MIVKNNYIIAIEPSDPDYIPLREKISRKPEDPEGYAYMLRVSDKEWELVKLPDPEPEDPDADLSDYEEQLQRLGVTL